MVTDKNIIKNENKNDNEGDSITSYKEEWIPVKKRLPENYDFVLVCDANEFLYPAGVDVAKFIRINDDTAIFDINGLGYNLSDGKITHWKPLPRLPKSNET